MVASDKLFYWLFQQHAERLQPLVAALLPRMDGYGFSAPVLKKRNTAWMACSSPQPINRIRRS
jgi:hypothetical protein